MKLIRKEPWIGEIPAEWRLTALKRLVSTKITESKCASYMRHPSPFGKTMRLLQQYFCEGESVFNSARSRVLMTTMSFPVDCASSKNLANVV